MSNIWQTFATTESHKFLWGYYSSMKLIFLEPLHKYAVFEGRASRKEFWLFFLFVIVFSFFLGVIDVIIGTYSEDVGLGALSGLFTIIQIIPTIAVGVRRLHDTNKKGSWLFIVLIPLIGNILITVFFCLKSNDGDNRFGANPNKS